MVEKIKEIKSWLHPEQTETLHYISVRLTLLIRKSGVLLDDITDTVSTTRSGFSINEIHFPEKCEVVWVQTEEKYNPDKKVHRTWYKYHLRVPKVCISLYVAAIWEYCFVDITAYEDCFYVKVKGGLSFRVKYKDFFHGNVKEFEKSVVDSVRNSVEYRSKDDPSKDTFDEALDKVVTSSEYARVLEAVNIRRKVIKKYNG